MAIDESKLNEFLDRFVTDLGATVAAGSVAIGHRLSPVPGRRGEVGQPQMGCLHHEVVLAHLSAGPNYVAVPQCSLMHWERRAGCGAGGRIGWPRVRMLQMRRRRFTRSTCSISPTARSTWPIRAGRPARSPGTAGACWPWAGSGRVRQATLLPGRYSSSSSGSPGRLRELWPGSRAGRPAPAPGSRHLRVRVAPVRPAR